ncbi:MAG: DUF255 domain-containing protein [Saprospiraceae bacterium]|nr:DUF255 domain-containing protein [Saprospiraceae bacterium]
MTKISIVVFLACFTQLAHSQESIHWMSWDEAIAKSKITKKKIFIDVYTDWCGWCKKMDKTTFQNPEVINLINENYYPVKFDAEYKKDIELNGNTYKYVSSGRRGYHELASALLRGRMSYPSIVFLNEDFELIQPIQGFQDAENLEMMLSYFAGNYHKTTPWKRFMANYHSEEKPTQKTVPVKYQPSN